LKKGHEDIVTFLPNKADITIQIFKSTLDNFKLWKEQFSDIHIDDKPIKEYYDVMAFNDCEKSIKMAYDSLMDWRIPQFRSAVIMADVDLDGLLNILNIILDKMDKDSVPYHSLSTLIDRFIFTKNQVKQNSKWFEDHCI